MAKTQISYLCSNCGYDTNKWIGKCPACGQWNTFKEFREAKSPDKSLTNFAGIVKTENKDNIQRKAMPLSEVSATALPRIDTRDNEFNRVLGGGIVPGSIILLGGEPGIGKSTLLLQTILHLSDMQILYVSGEESAQQIKLRANRISTSINDNIHVLCENSIENVFIQLQDIKPDLLIIDSIQTIITETVESSAGSVAQVRECASMLLRLAKTTSIPVVLVGHITKEGSLAGPKVLEHIVDTVIQFEGDRHFMYRILRSVKNRFGSTSELGVYEMIPDGLRPVENPGELLMTHSQAELSGIAVTCAIEGIRPFLIETQALVSTAAYGTPQRSATAFDQKRLNMLLAVLEKRVGFKLIQKDVFVNIAGGFKINDMAMDLSVISAVLSSNVDTPIPHGWCMAGEVGLSGEVRPVSRINQRISEAEKLGFTDILIPKDNLSGITLKKTKIKIHPVQKVEDALQTLFG